MNTVLLLLILIGLVGLLLVVFYLLDRVNSLHQQSANVALSDDSFGGLSGKALWDAMIGIPMPGWGKDTIATLRPRYEAVLQKHAELLFEDGELDGREGFSMPVRSERTVPTLRGEIQSWIPHEYASAIYRCGQNRATLPQEEHDDIRKTLDQTGMLLFAAVGLPPHGLSVLLMSSLQPAAPAEKPEDDPQAVPQEAPQEATPEVLALGSPEPGEQIPMVAQGELQAVSPEMVAADEAGTAAAAATTEKDQTATPAQAGAPPG